MKANGKIRRQGGTSLIELMIAMLVLGVGLLSSAAMTAVAINTNIRSKNDSSSTAVAQAVIAQISAIPLGTTTPIIIDNCGSSTTINTTGSTAGAGATLTSNGTIDFTQSFGAVATGYAMKYTTCDAVNGIKATYDVRWNITWTSSSGKEELLVVGARSMGESTTGRGYFYGPAVNLRTVVGNQGI